MIPARTRERQSRIGHSVGARVRTLARELDEIGEIDIGGEAGAVAQQMEIGNVAILGAHPFDSSAEHAPRLRDFLLHVKLLHAVSAGARGRVRAAAATGDQDTGEVAFQAGVSEAGRVNLHEPPPRKASSWVVLEAAAHAAVGTEESVAPDTIPSDEIYRTLIAQEK